MLDQLRVIRPLNVLPYGASVQVAQQVGLERLRGLDVPHLLSVERLHHSAVPHHLHGLFHLQPGDGSVGFLQRAHHRGEDLSRGERTRCVVNDHPGMANVLESGSDARLTRHTSGHHSRCIRKQTRHLVDPILWNDHDDVSDTRRDDPVVAPLDEGSAREIQQLFRNIGSDSLAAAACSEDRCSVRKDVCYPRTSSSIFSAASSSQFLEKVSSETRI